MKRHFAAFLLAHGSVAAFAAGPVEEVRAGVSLQSVGPISANVERGVALGAEVLFARLPVAWLGSPMPSLGGSLATAENSTSFAHAGLVWRIEPPATRLYFDLGAGAAVHDGRVSFNPAADFPRVGEAFLGCRTLFRLAGGPGVRIGDRLTAHVQWEHLSNAGLCAENEGLDNWGVRLGWRF